MSTNNPNQPGSGASAEAQETAPVAAENEQTAETSASPAVETTPNEPESANGEGGEMSMEDFGAILDRHESQRQAEVSEGEVVKGTVEKISDQGVIINIGFKSEGIVPLEEFKVGDQLMVKIGDEVDVFVKQLENHEGYVELSRADAVRMQTWDQIEN